MAKPKDKAPPFSALVEFTILVEVPLKEATSWESAAKAALEVDWDNLDEKLTFDYDDAKVLSISRT